MDKLSLIDVAKFVKKTDQSIIFQIIDVWKLNVENMNDFIVNENSFSYDIKNSHFLIKVQHLQNHMKDYTYILDLVNKKFYDVDKCYCYIDNDRWYDYHGINIELECDYENSMKQMKLIRNKVNHFHWRHKILL